MATISRQTKALYYLKAYLRSWLPANANLSVINRLKRRLTQEQIAEVESRTAYYNKMPTAPNPTGKYLIKDLRKAVKPKVYYFDAYKYAHFFDENLPVDFVFGDVIYIPEVPSIVKSRPISDDNKNSILLNLNQVRHVKWIKNDRPFSQKENKLIGRGTVFQRHRHRFYEMYFYHPMCDLGQINKEGGNPEWIKSKISIQQHLNYKFILCLQGNDVATNLKWVMSSNSIAVMPKPTMETWFMEGLLVGGKHYIEIKDDYSDLEEQLKFYIAHPGECQRIIDNAHLHCKQFFNRKVEDLCALRVLEKYFIN